MSARYDEAHKAALSDPERYWARHIDLIDWVTPPTIMLDSSESPLYRWFPDGTLNTCFNAVDRHVLAGHGDRTAIVYDSPVTGNSASVTYAELLDKVSAAAGGLRELGVDAGDRVVIYMPMIPEAVIAMLACARLGAVHSVVFGGFAPRELAARIDDALPVVVITASCGIEPGRILDYKTMVDEALDLATHEPDALVLVQRPQLPARLGVAREHDWADVLRRGAADPAGPVTVRATDPLYILYTSGTTGRPKGVVRDNGGHAVAMAWSLPNVYDIHPGQVWWSASDIGWVVGHSYIVYAPLINGSTTVLYEGKPVGTPDAGAFWRVIAEHSVEGLLAAPTAIRAIRKMDPDGQLVADHDVTSLRNLFLAGERLDPDTYSWATDLLGKPVVDNWWQTETGWPIAANLRGFDPMPIKPGSPTVPIPGFDVRILDEHGVQVEPGTDGAICIRLPLPPGTLPTLWGDDTRFVESYLSAFDGYYLTGDGGHIDEDGYLFVMGRTDDVINVAGHRLSTGAIEAVLSGHPAVAECAVIGAADGLKGQIPRGFVVLKSGSQHDREQLASELIALVRKEIGAIATPKDIVVVDGLPKTRSGKVLRKSMREIADLGTTTVPATIEDPAVLESIRSALGPLR
ncbi:acetate--CoA ligase [Nocardia sp. NBC_00565]|uniref:acetate--CoA ligase n=1 Tax=Nocardia sp. NBC_00565 TaxID=2975993 RepID=UPI002E80F044|nr:acetate--CoA ligase [Nocardia sp. NBC_00565]WUC06767.1 acetate--CoA ligase [Nocardia sp. NBC_00565]